MPSGKTGLFGSTKRDTIRPTPKVSKSGKTIAKRRSLRARARVRGNSLELLDPVPLRDGDEVTITISKAGSIANFESVRRAAGAWKGNVDAEALIASIYADRLIVTRPSPRV